MNMYVRTHLPPTEQMRDGTLPESRYSSYAHMMLENHR